MTCVPILKGNRKPVADTLPIVNRADMSTGRGTPLYCPDTCAQRWGVQKQSWCSHPPTGLHDCHLPPVHPHEPLTLIRHSEQCAQVSQQRQRMEDDRCVCGSKPPPAADTCGGLTCASSSCRPDRLASLQACASGEGAGAPPPIQNTSKPAAGRHTHTHTHSYTEHWRC